MAKANGAAAPTRSFWAPQATGTAAPPKAFWAAQATAAPSKAPAAVQVPPAKAVPPAPAWAGQPAKAGAAAPAKAGQPAPAKEKKAAEKFSLDLSVQQSFEVCVKLHWALTANRGVNYKVEDCVIEMAIDRSPPDEDHADKVPLKPAKDAMIKTVSMGTDASNSSFIQGMPLGRNFLIRAVAKIKDEQDMDLGEDFGFVKELMRRKGDSSVQLFHDDFGISLHIQHGQNTSNSILLRDVGVAEAQDLDVMELAPFLSQAEFGPARRSNSYVPMNGLLWSGTPPSGRMREVSAHLPSGKKKAAKCPINATAGQFLDMLEERDPSTSGLALFRVPPEGAMEEELRDDAAVEVLGLGFLLKMPEAKAALTDGSKCGEQWKSLLEEAKRPMQRDDRLGLRTAALWLRPPVRSGDEDEEDEEGDAEEWTIITATPRMTSAKKFFSSTNMIQVRMRRGALACELPYVLHPDFPASAKVLAEKPGQGMVQLDDMEELPPRIVLSDFTGRRSFYTVFSKRENAIHLRALKRHFLHQDRQDMLQDLWKLAKETPTRYRMLLCEYLAKEVYPSVLRRLGLPDEQPVQLVVSSLRSIGDHLDIAEMRLETEYLMQNPAEVEDAEQLCRDLLKSHGKTSAQIQRRLHELRKRWWAGKGVMAERAAWAEYARWHTTYEVGELVQVLNAEGPLAGSFFEARITGRGVQPGTYHVEFSWSEGAEAAMQLSDVLDFFLEKYSPEVGLAEPRVVLYQLGEVAEVLVREGELAGQFVRCRIEGWGRMLLTYSVRRQGEPGDRRCADVPYFDLRKCEDPGEVPAEWEEERAEAEGGKGERGGAEAPAGEEGAKVDSAEKGQYKIEELLDASRQILAAYDVDEDGALNFGEYLLKEIITKGSGPTVDDYVNFCLQVGADLESGIHAEQLFAGFCKFGQDISKEFEAAAKFWETRQAGKTLLQWFGGGGYLNWDGFKAVERVSRAEGHLEDEDAIWERYDQWCECLQADPDQGLSLIQVLIWLSHEGDAASRCAIAEAKWKAYEQERERDPEARLW